MLYGGIMRVYIGCCMALLMMAGKPQSSLCQQAPGQQKAAGQAAGPVKPGEAAAPATPPLSDEDKANQLSEQVGKLMVKCVNLLTAQDPLSLDYCKQQRDLADQYPPRLRILDKMMAHDEYGIALAAFDHKPEALEEFNLEIALVPRAVKPGSPEWSTAYWHRAMIYAQLGEAEKAERDYRAAEENFRKASLAEDSQSTEKKRRTILRQHAALLQKEGKTEAAHQLLEEAAK
jgi:tetratricopeptide (TPR) repeat protein